MILLDTNALIRHVCEEGPELGPQSRKILAAGLKEGTVGVSAVTFWEAAMLAKKGRVRLPVEAGAWREDVLLQGFAEFPLDGNIAVLSVRMSVDTNDPFDRFIAATAADLGASLMTADRALLRSRKIPTLNAGK